MKVFTLLQSVLSERRHGSDMARTFREGIKCDPLVKARGHRGSLPFHGVRGVLWVALAGWLVLAGIDPLSAAESVQLETLDLSKLRQGWGLPQINRSMRERPMAIAGQAFANGVGTHAHSTLWLELGGGPIGSRLPWAWTIPRKGRGRSSL